MALVVDSEMPGNVGFQNNSVGAGTQTFNFNNVAGTLLVALVAIGAAGAEGGAVTAASFDGAPLVPITDLTTNADGVHGGHLYAYYLLSPSLGSKVLSATITLIGGTSNSYWAGCISFTGNDLVTPVKQSTSTRGSSTAASATLPGVVAGNISLGCAGMGTHPSAQSQTRSFLTGTFDGNAMGNGELTRSVASGSVAHNFTLAGSDSWAEIAFEIAAAAAASPAQAQQLLPLSVSAQLRA